MHTPMILLPDRVYILRDRRNQTIKTNREEYNIYFENVIFPYLPGYDVQVDCKYGRNLGNFWRIDDFPDESGFPLAIRIFDNFTGELLCEKETTVFLAASRQHERRFTLLAIGDSMTQSEVYLEHVAMKLKNLDFVGTRSFNGIVRHEGRGGWSSSTFMEKTGDRYGMSPFLFPDGVAPEEYYGEVSFMENAGAEDSADTYVFDGFTPEEINGRAYLKDGKLMRGTDVIDSAPRFRFDFGGYLKRWKIPTPDAVSILLGCNDLASKSYSDYKPALDRLIGNIKAMIDSIRKACPTVKILIMTPIPGGSGYAWGLSRGCFGSAAMFRHIIAHTADRLISEFGSREDEGLFIVSSHMTIDPVYGYKNDTRKANIHSEHQVFVNTDGIHPNHAGYRQMGDALAGAVEAVRS